METSELYRGRLIDHLQLVVQDLASSKMFYTAVLGVLHIPISGDGDGFFWAWTATILKRYSTAKRSAARHR